MPQQNVKPRILRLLNSFHYAFTGWWYCLRTQNNTRIHALATISVVAMGLWLDIQPSDWVLLTLAITIVWVAEMINTAVETTIDLCSPGIQTKAKIAKDVAAGAVLAGAVGAIIVGFLILGPPLFERIKGTGTQ